MIGQLTGTILEEDLDGSLVLGVGGVGYEMAAPLGAVGRARGRTKSEGSTLTFYVHTHVREDALSLFAFATPEDKSAFRMLISVSNVGPKMALSLLSAFTAEEFSRIIATKDLSRLVGVPGIGKKTAERLLLELADKLKGPVSAVAGTSPTGPRSGAPAAELLTSALVRMGYRPAEADRAVTTLGGRVEHEPMGDLIREALAFLVR